MQDEEPTGASLAEQQFAAEMWIVERFRQHFGEGALDEIGQGFIPMKQMVNWLLIAQESHGLDEEFSTFPNG